MLIHIFLFFYVFTLKNWKLTADILELFILECESVRYRFSKGVSLKNTNIQSSM